jgi:[NiFe] hydrogenase diaphorase moiety small subunit
MNQLIKFKIDGAECMGHKGQYIVDAARENNIYIPTLCNIPGVRPRGACRICSVRVNGKLMTACTTPIVEGMEIENKATDIEDLRKAIIELLFTEGNHFCPSCERSGDCELQALSYRYQMLVPRFKFQFSTRNIEASHPKLIKDHNRCILCKRCIRAVKDDKGRSLFAFGKRRPQCGNQYRHETLQGYDRSAGPTCGGILPGRSYLGQRKGICRSDRQTKI